MVQPFDYASSTGVKNRYIAAFKNDSLFGIFNADISQKVKYNLSFEAMNFITGDHSGSPSTSSGKMGIYLCQNEQFSEYDMSPITITKDEVISGGDDEANITLNSYWTQYNKQFTVGKSSLKYIVIEPKLFNNANFIDGITIEKAIIQSSTVSNYTPSLNEEVTIEYTIYNPRKDNTANTEAIVFQVVSGSLPSGVQIVSSGTGGFDASGNYTIPVGGITTEKKITLKIKCTSTSLNNSKFTPQIKVISAEGTTNDGLIYTEPSPIMMSDVSWTSIMSSTSQTSMTAPGGTQVVISPVGPLNTQAITTEITSNPSLYAGMTEQQRTIAAAKRLYGDGCTFAISAQNAWYALGLADQYVMATTYNLVSTANDISGATKTYHATGDLTAANVISNGSNVELKAGNTITLTNGFNSKEGFTHAFIVQCTNYEVKSGVEDNATDSASTVTAAEEVAKNEPAGSSQNITVKPNPSNGKFTVSSSEPIGMLTVVSPSGIVIYQAQNVGTSQEVNLEKVAKGIYIVTVVSGSNTKIEKIAITK